MMPNLFQRGAKIRNLLKFKYLTFSLNYTKTKNPFKMKGLILAF
jgi:hypothetical protein